ncbi:MAG: hypothetical protein ACFFDC_15185 [Promethearchaeota archaeon]
MAENNTDNKHYVLHSAETALINHLKQLSSLPTQPPKKKDPIVIILQKHIKEWRSVKK